MATRVLKVLILTLAISALAVACGKDKKPEGGGGTTATGGGGGGEGASRAGGGSGAGGGLTVFPASSTLVGGINVASITQNKLFKQFWPMIEAQAGSELSEFKAACGIDILTAFNSVSFGGNMGDNESIAVAVNTNLGKDKILACAKTMAEKQGETIEIQDEGKLVGIKDGDDTDVQWIGWQDDKTIVTGAKAENDKAWLEARLAGQESVTGNKAIMDLVGKTNTGASVWVALIPPAEGSPFAGMPGEQPTAVYASIDFAKGLKIDAGLRYATADGAKAMADQANGMMGGMKADPNLGKFLAKTSVTAAGNDLVVKMDLNEQELDELAQMVQQQLPMLMMMMGG
jgi:hypothetical protein